MIEMANSITRVSKKQRGFFAFDSHSRAPLASVNLVQSSTEEILKLPVEICTLRATRVIRDIAALPANNGIQNNTWLSNNYIAMRRGGIKIILGSYAHV